MLRTGIGRLARPLTSSLRTKLIAWFFVPTAIILVCVALVNFYSYQDVTEDLVIERDRDLTQLWAGQLATNLDRFPKVLSDVSHTLGISRQSDADVQASLSGASAQLRIFDGGVILLNTFGAVTATHPLRPDIVGQDRSDGANSLQMVRSPGPVFSDVLYDDSQEIEVIEVAVPINGDQGQFLGSIVGVFDLRASSISAFYSGIVRLRIGNGGSYIVDGNGKVLYHDDPDQVGADFGTRRPVTQVLLGEVGAIRNKDQSGTDQVSAFAPIPGTPWGLVTEESWSSLTSGSRNTQRFLLLLLALGVAVPAIVVAIGLKRVMRPVEELKKAAKEIARGNFGQTIDVHSGDEIEELATEFNLMAEQLKGSYEELEQRVAERTEELGASEQRYRTLFEQSRDAIFIRSPEGKFIDINQAALDLFGFDRAEALGSDVGERYVNRADQQKFEQELVKFGSVRDFEEKLRKRDGTEIDCLVTSNLLRSADGAVVGYEGIVRDITERKRAEAAVREAEQRYRTLFEDSSDAIFIGNQGRIVAVNQTALELFEFSLEEAIGSITADRFVDPADLSRFREELARLGSVRDFEVQLRKNDGTVMDCLVTASRRVDGDENTLGELQGIIRDITESKQAEEALREAEHKYRGIFDDSKDPIYITSREGYIVDANQSFLELFGYDDQELTGLATQDMCVTPGDHRTLMRVVDQQGSVKDYEIQLLKKDGTVLDCLVSLTLHLHEAGEIVTYQGMARDVTESKQAAEAALQQTREVAVLEERNRMAREIHDTMAQGFTGIVLQLGAAEQTVDEGSGEIADHLGRAKGLAREGLQEARRSVWGLLPHALEQMPLDNALEGEVKRFDTAGQFKTAFTLSGNRRDLPTEVQTVLFRICQESLSNVSRHAAATEVKVKLNYDPREVRLSIQDNGIGFDPDAVQNGDRRSFGLISMEQRARGLEGSLEIKSSKGRGTLVEVVIPTL